MSTSDIWCTTQILATSLPTRVAAQLGLTDRHFLRLVSGAEHNGHHAYGGPHHEGGLTLRVDLTWCTSAEWSTLRDSDLQESSEL
ncbi:unnamed protein product [Linum trigynum]|uniref:Uncharacterized protein n=1 Tax=Linum trigynum TaxID=586398 RepID=A0AAV2E1R4_9ROSI